MTNHELLKPTSGEKDQIKKPDTNVCQTFLTYSDHGYI